MYGALHVSSLLLCRRPCLFAAEPAGAGGGCSARNHCFARPDEYAVARPCHEAATQAATGGGPDKVWVNLNSSTYHCFGDRYYGKTANGRYMTEAAAKSAGAHGAGGKTCPVAK